MFENLGRRTLIAFGNLKSEILRGVLAQLVERLNGIDAGGYSQIILPRPHALNHR